MTELQIDEFGQSYLRLALEIDKHLEGYVDAYYGPNYIKEEVESGPILSPLELREVYELVVDSIPTDNPGRCRYLKAITSAIGCTVDKINGKSLEYTEEIYRLLGIIPSLVDEDEFWSARTILESHIPGNGPLVERIEKRTSEQKIPPDDLPKALELILDELRDRSYRILDYHPGEWVKYKFVNDKPWSMDCHYLGNYRSEISINTDHEYSPLRLILVLTHEAYPGHHTEFQTKEAVLYHDKGYIEQSCILGLTPAGILIEGIANTAIDIISPEMEIFEWLAETLIPKLGLPSRTAEELWHLSKRREINFKARNNASILYHAGQISQEETIDYIIDHGLCNRNFAEIFSRMIVHPLYSPYIFAYTEGYQLIKNVSIGKDKLHFFKKLLNEQVLPEDLINLTD